MSPLYLDIELDARNMLVSLNENELDLGHKITEDEKIKALMDYYYMNEEEAKDTLRKIEQLDIDRID